MSKALMTFIISLVILAAAVLLLFFGKVEVAVGVSLMTLVAGYWIRDVQDRVGNSPPAVSPAEGQSAPPSV